MCVVLCMYVVEFNITDRVRCSKQYIATADENKPVTQRREQRITEVSPIYVREYRPSRSNVKLLGNTSGEFFTVPPIK